jgi:sugar lactone lactonase YvrE
VAVAPDGTIYLADPIKQQVLAIDAAGKAVRVVAGTGASGSGDGAGDKAKFNGPAGVAVAADGSLLVTDVGNGSLRRVTLDGDGNATVSTVLTGLQYPGGVIVAPDGTIYVTESGHPLTPLIGPNRVSKVVLHDGAAPTVTVLAGSSNGFADGAGASAKFTRPTGLALAPDGTLYVADAENNRIRTIKTDAAGQVTVATFAGTGVKGPGGKTIATAQFDRPTGVVLDDRGRLIVTDYWNARLQVIDPADGSATTMAGALGDGYSDGPAAQARFSRPVAIARDAQGHLYVADAHPWAVRKVVP